MKRGKLHNTSRKWVIIQDTQEEIDLHPLDRFKQRWQDGEWFLQEGKEVLYTLDTILDGKSETNQIEIPVAKLVEGTSLEILEQENAFHLKNWEEVYSEYKGVSDLVDFFEWLKQNYKSPQKK